MAGGKVIKGSGGGAPSGRAIAPRSGLARGGGGNRVVQRGVAEAQNSAQEIILKAQQEAEQIRSQAEEYRQKGLEEGLVEGREIGKAEMTEAILRMNRENEARYRHFERDLVKLSLTIAEKIVGEQMRVEPNTITDIVANALQAVRHQREIYIRVNTEDYETIAAQKYMLVEQLSRASDIDIRPDPEIERGGCLVESEQGTIDASLEKQLNAIEKILLGEGH